MTDGLLRIGEVSRRVGVPVGLLRAWERRYGLLEPARTAGGFRLYSEDDVSRVRIMRAHLDRGLSAAEAARAALAAGSSESPTVALEASAGELAVALESFDEGAAQSALDRLLSTLSLEVVVGEVLIPYFRRLGEKWERGEISVGQEHFASNVVRGRLLGLARGWGRGVGPRALLACADGEQHDLPLLLFGLLLREHGWSVSFLGTATPSDALVAAAVELDPAAVLVSGTVPGVFEPMISGLRELADHAPLYVGGAAASPELADEAGAEYLDGDLVAAARAVAERNA